MQKSTSWQKNFMYAGITLATNALVPLITYPYLTRTLGPQSLGQYNFAFAFAHIFFLAAQFGLPYYGVKEIAKVSEQKEKLNKTASELLLINVLVGLVLSSVYVALVFLLPVFNVHIGLFMVIGVIVFFAPLLFNWLFQGLERFRYVALRNVVFRVFGMVLMFILVKDADHAIIYAAIMAFVMVGHVGINLYLSTKIIKFSFKNIRIKRHFAPAFFAMPIMLVNIAIVQVGTVMVGTLSSLSQVAYYAIPAQIIMVLTGVMTALSYVMAPRLAHLLKQGKSAYLSTAKTVMQFSWALVLPMAVGLILLAPVLMQVFAGTAFLPSVATLKVGALRLIPAAVTHFAGAQILLANNQQKKLFASLGIGVLVMVLFSVWLVPLYGSVGAMTAALIAETIMAVAQIILGRKYLGKAMFINKKSYKYVLASLLIVPVCMLTKAMLPTPWQALAVGVLLSAIVYVGALLVLKDTVFLQFFAAVFKSKTKR